MGSRKRGRIILAFFLLLFSFLFIIPLVIGAPLACQNQQVIVNTIDDFIAAEQIRLGQRMEGVAPLSIVREGDAADTIKVYDVLNSFFPEAKRAVPVKQHKETLAAKLSEAARKTSLDSLVAEEVKSLARSSSEEKTVLSLMDLFYLDKEMKGRNYFSPDKVKKAVETLPKEQKEKIVRVMGRLGDEIKKKKSLFETETIFGGKKEIFIDIEKLRSVHREALSTVLFEESVSQQELLDMMGTVLARQTGDGSVTAVSQRNIESLLQFDQALDGHIVKNGLQQDTKVVGLLSDIEPAMSVRMARKGSAPVEMAYISRASMMSDGEKLVYYQELRTNPSLLLDESRLDRGLVYSKIYRKNQDGTEAGIFVESRDVTKKLGFKEREAEHNFQQEFGNKLNHLLDTDPEFAKEAERIYSQLRLGDEDVVFIDTGFKGTIPTFLAAMHRVKHPNRRALTYLYGVKEDFAEIIPHFVIGRNPVKRIEYMGKFSEIGAFSPVEGALVGKTSPKEQLMASIDQFLIGKAGQGHEPIPPQSLRPVLRDVEPLPIQPRPVEVPSPASAAQPEKIIDATIQSLQSELARTKIGDKFAPSNVKVTKKISGDGQSVYEISGTHVDARGLTVGGFGGGESFSHTLFVNEQEGTATIHRTFAFSDAADKDGTLVAKVLAAEEERLAPVLRQMGINEYLTYPKHDLELATICRIHPCTFEAPVTTVMSDMERWLGSADGARYLETAEGKTWLETNRKRGVWAGIKRFFGVADEIDGNKVGMAAENYPDAFLRGKKYPVRVDVSAAPEQVLKDAVTAPFEVTPRMALKDIKTESLDLSEGALLEAPPVKKTPLAGRKDIDDSVKVELKRLGVAAISDATITAVGTPKTLSSAVAPDSLLGKLDGAGAGFSKARRVELADGRTVVWKLDTSNPITANLQHGKVLGVTDGGRRQLGMAAILDEFDTVVVPRMRRLQTVDGYGIIESEFINGYTSLGKQPSQQFRRLDDMLRNKEITPREYGEIVSQAQEQGVVNLMFGNSDVELGFVKLPHAEGADPSTYIRLARFDEEFAFQGLLDYPLLHQTVPWLGLEKLMSSGNDQILGMFIRDDFLTAAKTIDVEKLRSRFTPIAKKLEDIVSDEAGFMGKLQRAGYQDDEARTILNGAQKHVAQLKQELETGAPGNLQKLIDNNGELLATADGGFISKSERLKKQLPQQPMRTTPHADYAKADPDRVVEFVPREKLMATRMAGVSSFDYNSLQAMNILGISPEAARTRDVRRIGAAYREEVGLLDAGEQTPQLAKLVEEGVLTPQEYVQLRKGAPMMMGGPTQEDLEKILIPFFENPVKLGEARGLEGKISHLYDRVGKKNIDEVFQLNLENDIGPNIYGGKAVVYVRDDGSIAVAFMTETAKTHHRHALANIIGGEKGKLVYEGLYGDYRIADIPNRAFGFQLIFDKKRGKIIGIKHNSQITKLQFGKGARGWRLDENVVNHIDQQLLNKIDPELFDDSFFNKPINQWIDTKELPIASQCV